jgi:hypothetical protein
MQMDQYKQSQKIRQVLEICQTTLQSLERNVAEKESEIRDLSAAKAREHEKSQNAHGLLNAMLKELKNLSMKEVEIHKAANCQADQGFVNFLSETVFLKPEDLGEERIPSEFFSIPDIEQRKKIIAKMISADSFAFQFLSAQFCINAVLLQQRQKLLGAVATKEEIEGLLRLTKCSDANEIAEHFQAYRSTIASLKKSNAHLKSHTRLLLQKEAKAHEDVGHDDEVERLEKECERRGHQIQSLAAELAAQKKENNHEWKNSALKLEARIAELERSLQSKTNEITHLNSVIKDHEKFRETERNTNSQLLRKQERESLERIESLQQQIRTLMGECDRKGKRYRTQIKTIKQENEAKTAELAGFYDQSKQRFETMIAGLQQKIEAMRESSQTLMQSLSESKSRNHHLKDENGELRIAQRSLELKNAALQESVQKEKLTMQNQMSASKLMLATQLQNMNQSMISQANARKEQTFDILIKKVQGIYHIDRNDFDDDSYDNLTNQIRVDLQRLQAFQSERVTSTLPKGLDSHPV